MAINNRILPKIEIADVILKFESDYIKKYNPNSWQLRTLNALKMCRTSSLGGHKYKCDNCGHEQVSYNSCRNRHCPKCQGSKQAFWVEDVSRRLIDNKYFHVVFTVPEQLNKICILDSKWFYATLFKSVWETLRTFGYMKYGVETGALAVLHTWGQSLSLHPHIHCLVPAMGVDLQDRVRIIAKQGKYLYPIDKMRVDFRSVMMKNIKAQLTKTGQLSKYKQDVDRAWSKRWVIHSEPSFGDVKNVIKYLGIYTHRVAITNDRIQSITDDTVSFYYKDYKDESKVKIMTLLGVEFLRRFIMHFLPKGFVKVRYYGILSVRYRNKLAVYKAPQETVYEYETTQERMFRLTGIDVSCCPICRIGRMIEVSEIPKIRSPAMIVIN